MRAHARERANEGMNEWMNERIVVPLSGGDGGRKECEPPFRRGRVSPFEDSASLHFSLHPPFFRTFDSRVALILSTCFLTYLTRVSRKPVLTRPRLLSLSLSAEENVIKWWSRFVGFQRGSLIMNPFIARGDRETADAYLNDGFFGSFGVANDLGFN